MLTLITDKIILNVKKKFEFMSNVNSKNRNKNIYRRFWTKVKTSTTTTTTTMIDKKINDYNFCLLLFLIYSLYTEITKQDYKKKKKKNLHAWQHSLEIDFYYKPSHLLVNTF